MLTARYWTRLAPTQWRVRACQCGFCRIHAALTTSDPAGSLQFACVDPRHLQRYRFASGATDFLLCRQCGVYLGARIGSAEHAFGVLNVRTLPARRMDLPEAIPMDYAAETPQARRARREARWTPLAPGSL